MGFTHPPLIGFAMDGYTIYGKHIVSELEGGTLGLDRCGGHSHGEYGYHYHAHTLAHQSTNTLIGVNASDGPFSYTSYMIAPTTCWHGDVNVIENFWSRDQVAYERNEGEDSSSWADAEQLRPCCQSTNVYTAPAIEIDGAVAEEHETLPSGHAAVWNPTVVRKLGGALKDAVAAGDGGGFEEHFRNSGVLVKDGSYYGINGASMVTNFAVQTGFQEAPPKSLIKANLITDSIEDQFTFTHAFGHDIDLEAIAFGPDEGEEYIYIGDERNFIYQLRLSDGELTQEWDLSTIGLNSGQAAGGLKSLTYAADTDHFYAGVQNRTIVAKIKLDLSSSSIALVDNFQTWKAPSGLFYYPPQSALYIVMGLNDDGNTYIGKYSTTGKLECGLLIPPSFGLQQAGGFYVAGRYAFIADAEGSDSNHPDGGAALYQVHWDNPCGGPTNLRSTSETTTTETVPSTTPSTTQMAPHIIHDWDETVQENENTDVQSTTLPMQLRGIIRDGWNSAKMESKYSLSTHTSTTVTMPTQRITDDRLGTVKRTCDELGWSEAINGVCAGNARDHFLLGSVNCPEAKSAAGANKLCQDQGARLCSVSEIETGVAKNVGCGMQSNLVWTSTWCGFSNYGGKQFVVQGDGASVGRVCRNPTNSHTAVCCADTVIATADAIASTKITTTTTMASTRRRTCEELGWGAIINGVCGEADKGMKSKDGSDKCYSNRNAMQAEKICSLVGARMCASSEIIAGSGRSTGCSMDNKFVWTDTRCALVQSDRSKSGYLTGFLSSNAQGQTECKHALSNGPVKCCSDVHLPNADFPVVGRKMNGERMAAAGNDSHTSQYGALVRSSSFGGFLHSRMPFVPMPARLKGACV
jgi:hypothetical protein